jgi:hypothetical protein
MCRFNTAQAYALSSHAACISTTRLFFNRHEKGKTSANKIEFCGCAGKLHRGETVFAVNYLTAAVRAGCSRQAQIAIVSPSCLQSRVKREREMREKFLI